VLYVGDGTGGEIVDNVDLVAVAKMPFGKMRTDESCTSGDEDLHSASWDQILKYTSGRSK
jgi:hypothetical protein